MRIRTILAALAAPVLIAGAALTVTAGPALAGTGNLNGAMIARDFGCFLGDGNGNTVFTTTSQSVINTNNTTTKCSATVAPSDTGTAVQFRGFPCGVELYDGTFVFTTKSQETVSASGQAMLTCSVNGASG